LKGRFATDPWIRSAADMQAFLAAHFAEAEPEHAYEHGDLVAHGTDVAARFAAKGFTVSRMPAPAPTVTIGLEVYKDPAGAVVRQRVFLNFIHRSYVNSLIVDGHVFVPSYAGEDTLNQAAVELYRSLGLTAQSIDMTETIKAGGAVHCLSRPLY
jgi:agmatine/peptidylarginine deiminase